MHRVSLTLFHLLKAARLPQSHAELNEIFNIFHQGTVGSLGLVTSCVLVTSRVWRAEEEEFLLAKGRVEGDSAVDRMCGGVEVCSSLIR